MFKGVSKLFAPHILWCFGFATITFDKVASFDLFGFTIKSYYFYFMIAALVLGIQSWKENKLSSFLYKIYKLITKPPLLYFSLLLIYCMAMGPFGYAPYKSFAYSILGWFQIIITASCGFLLWRKAEQKNANPINIWLYYLALSVITLSIITTIDYVAHFYGFQSGLIGFNQDADLKINVSRPHAFSYEPSYLAMYLSLACSFLFSDLLMSPKKLPLKLSLSSLLLGLLAIILCASRSGWAITALYFSGILLLQFYKGWRPQKKQYLILLIIPVTLLCFFLLTPKTQLLGLQTRFITPLYTMEDGPTNARIQSMLYGLDLGIETHLLGTGLGASFIYWVKSYGILYLNEIPPLSFKSELIMSLWSQIFAEAGLPGLILFSCFAFSLIFKLWQAFKKNPDAFTAASFTTATIFFIFMAHWIGNNVRSDIWVWYTIWIYAAFRDKDAKVSPSSSL